MSLHCKLVPVQYRVYENGILLLKIAIEIATEIAMGDFGNLLFTEQAGQFYDCHQARLPDCSGKEPTFLLLGRNAVNRTREMGGNRAC